MRRLAACALVAALGLVVTGCPGGDDETDSPDGSAGTPDGAVSTDSAAGGTVGVYSCIAPSGHCLEFLGSKFRSAPRRDVERMACTSNSGQFQETPCTGMGRLGRCLRDQGTADERATHFYAGVLATLQMQCTQVMGIWTAM